MALVRYIGSSVIKDFPSAFNVTVCDPMDDRLIVDREATIWNGTSFQVDGNYTKIYRGIMVYAIDTKSTYMFVGSGDTSGVLNTEANKKANWRLISSNEGSLNNILDGLNQIARATGISGTTNGGSNDTPNFGYEPYTNNQIISGAGSIEEAAEMIADALSDDELVVAASLNDLNSRLKPAHTAVTYNSSTNVMTFTSDNGNTSSVDLSDLSSGSIIDDITYNSSTKKLTIWWHVEGETSTKTHSRSIDVTSMFTAYSFLDTDSTIVTTSGDASHNVKFKTTTASNGSASVYADVDEFNCGEYS